MFIGYEVKSNQNQAKPMVLEADIKLSHAVLDPSSIKGKNKEPVCLVAEYNKKQFILAVLDPSQAWQQSLDLLFAAGSQLKLFVRGSGTVHLTGYEHEPADDFDFAMSESDDESVPELEDANTSKKDKVGSAKKETNKKANGVNKLVPKKANGKPMEPKSNESSDDSEDDEDFDVDGDSDLSDEDDSDEMMDDSDDDLGELDDEDLNSDEDDE